MTKFSSVLLLVLIGSVALAQSPAPVDSFLVADWHFNESSGATAIDSAAYDNHCGAMGTSVVAGVKGYGRSFNGTSDYMVVSSPRLLDFAPSQSFRIDFSFKTDATDGIILAKGLATLPGYMISVMEGHLAGMVGDWLNLTPPDTLLSIVSTQRVDDNAWHRASFIRDRMSHKLFLSIDGVEAASPVEDNVTSALANGSSLLIGRWENYQAPNYFRGQLDEIRILRFFPVLSDTQSVWHFDEPSSGSAYDASIYRDTAQVTGTTVVPGISGNARKFNGSGDCMWVPDLQSGALDFGVSTSFTVEAWFKTSSANDQIIVEKGLITQPGFSLQMDGGKVGVIVGNSYTGTPPDGWVTIVSTNVYNDNNWHLARFVRDRAVNLLFLYVDGILAASPVHDYFPYAIASDRPMTIGRWEDIPYYFNGVIDEVAIYRGALHPTSGLAPHLVLSTQVVKFEKVRVGDSTTAVLRVSNMGFQDSLRVSEIQVAPPFSFSPGVPLVVASRSSANLSVTYRPTAAGQDTMSMLLATNDPAAPSAVVHLQGVGVTPAAAPTIMSIKDIPADAGKQVRVVWLRSIYDGLDNSQKIARYDVWRRVDDGPQGMSPGTVLPGGANLMSVGGVLWDFIATVPPMGFDEYSVVAPTLYDSTAQHGVYESVFLVSARTSTDQGYLSEPDSGYSIDNRTSPDPGGITDVNANGDQGPRQFSLHQNFPNPFNPSTRIRFDVPSPSHVIVRVFDVLGRQVATLVDEEKGSGQYTVVWNAGNTASGIYLCRMEAGVVHQTVRMILLK